MGKLRPESERLGWGVGGSIRPEGRPLWVRLSLCLLPHSEGFLDWRDLWWEKFQHKYLKHLGI